MIELTEKILMKIDEIMGEIKDEHGMSNAIGYKKCPICNNTIKYIVNSHNGHVHMICGTENCLQIME